MSFEDDLKAEREAPIKFTDVQVELNGTLHTFRFLQLSGPEWAAETDYHPARATLPDEQTPDRPLIPLVDQRYGYNIRSLCMSVAKKTGRRVEGEKLVELTPQQWDDLYRAIPGSTKAAIDDAIWTLNEAEPTDRILSLKKASAAASAKSSD